MFLYIVETKYKIWYKFYCVFTHIGEVPKWLKGLASNTSRSIASARGFKSLLLRYLCHMHSCI